MVEGKDMSLDGTTKACNNTRERSREVSGENTLGRECSGYVHTYNHTHMIGDHVDWWVDDCYWSAKIIKIDRKTNKATLRFPPPPNGEGQTGTAPLESLRPSFSWTPKSQWRQVGLKVSVKPTTISLLV